MLWIYIGIAILLLIYGPLWGIKAAGYLIQKYKFGISFKELHEYHKEQDKLSNKEI